MMEDLKDINYSENQKTVEEEDDIRTILKWIW